MKNYIIISNSLNCLMRGHFEVSEFTHGEFLDFLYVDKNNLIVDVKKSLRPLLMWLTGLTVSNTGDLETDLDGTEDINVYVISTNSALSSYSMAHPNTSDWDVSDFKFFKVRYYNLPDLDKLDISDPAKFLSDVLGTEKKLNISRR